MTFKEVLAQVIDWLQENKRISYRALKRQFDLDDEYLEDIKDELRVEPNKRTRSFIADIDV